MQCTTSSAIVSKSDPPCVQNFEFSAPNQAQFYDELRTERSIRLLRLLDSEPNSGNDQLAFALEQFEFHQCPEYHAVSYTWAPPYLDELGDFDTEPKLDFSVRMLVNGAPFAMTQNPVDALAHFSKFPGCKYFWIDCVCICQSHMGERTGQILLMSKIYAGASEVLIWLGGEHPDRDHFTWTTNHFMPQIERHIKETGEYLILTQLSANPSLARDLDLEDSTEHLLGSFRFYRSCRWFHRAWVVQEIALARGYRVFCGNVEIRLSSLRSLNAQSLTMSEILRQVNDLPTSQTSLGPKMRGIGMQTTLMLEIRDRLHNPGLSRLYEQFIFGPIFRVDNEVKRGFAWLFILVHQLRTTDSSDKRDKIFAVLGLADHYFPSPVDGYIKPDYSCTVETAFVAFTTLVIFYLESFNVLTFVEDQSLRRTRGLPSWVPDYDAGGFYVPLLMVACRSSFIFNVSGDRGYTNLLSRLGYPALALTPTGAMFCKVAEYGAKDAQTEPEGHSEVFLQLLRLCEAVPSDVYGQNRVDVLWRTLVADTTPAAEHPAPESFGMYFRSFLLVTLGRFIATAGSPESTHSILRSLESTLAMFTAEVRSGQLASFEEILERVKDETIWPPAQATAMITVVKQMEIFSGAMMLVLGYRLVFRTAQNFLGVGPYSMQKDDQIWLIQGCDVPLVLRPRSEDSNTYMLVGECYLQGFMHGEMLEPRWEMDRKMRDIELY